MRAFLELHAPLIWRLARSQVRVAADASDVAQAVMTSLLEQHAQGRIDPKRIENAEAYLRVVVRNAVRSAGARNTRDRGAGDDALADIAAPTPSPEEATREAVDERRFVQRLKERLRPRDALAFALLIEDGLDIDEVATALGTTANNVYQMRHRILAASRALQSESMGTHGGVA
jgi:RNA polymerase sigma factor (sigma-70 family)